jgi:hypothetical protein
MRHPLAYILLDWLARRGSLAGLNETRLMPESALLGVPPWENWTLHNALLPPVAKRFKTRNFSKKHHDYVVEDRRINRDRSLPRQQRLHQELNPNLQLHPHSFTSFDARTLLCHLRMSLIRVQFLL